MAKKNQNYSNESIVLLKGPDRVRKRPGVIFGSDDIEGCIHAFFEIVSNSVDEAKAGYGDRIEVIKFEDNSFEVKDFGRGVPMDWNEQEQNYNALLVFSELYSGGKMDNSNYDYSLGLNGLGAAATQYASEWFEVVSIRDGYEYSLRFERGFPTSDLKKKRTKEKVTGTTIRWKPDIDVFTDIDIPVDRIQEILKQQAIVNAGTTFSLFDEASMDSFEYFYENGIQDYINEIANNESMTETYLFSGSGTGRDRADKDDYWVKAEVAFCFNNKEQLLKYFHNSSPLEYGGSPDKAVKSALVSAFDKEIKTKGKYTAKESKVTFVDIQDSLMLVINSFSTQTSYENQTKKAINNKFIQEFLTDLIKKNMEVWFIEHKSEAEKVVEQVLINKRSREQSETQRITAKKKLMEKVDVTNKVKKFVDCRSKDPNERELFICLKGDTKVKLVNEGSVEIEKLVGRTDLIGYSTTSKGDVFEAQIKEVFKTREVTRTIKLGFNDGSFVECTPEHKFLDVKTLTWVEAEDLYFTQELLSENGILEVATAEFINYPSPIPVYCLNIDSDFHSFILENGLITHNCEGDSAAGSLITARNPVTQAIMPIRGKILNIQKASLQSVFTSEIIMDLIRVMGCGVEIRGKKLPKDIPQFNEDRLKFNKIVIIADQDVDGQHIICLVTTMIYKLCPQLIEKGYLYYALTPLFEITDKSGKNPKTLYAFSDEERDELIKGRDPKKLTIQRSKGLGENSSEVMHEFISPGTRKFIRITSDEASVMDEYFSLFMGNDVTPRKTYIEEHFEDYDLEDLDLQ